jgi:HCOMODA/2-hydroxy-3-carboxy-muconic semialdehyde decarboxylase
LAVANHILYDQGILDGFGHVSMRDPASADHFLLSRNLAPALVTARDILRFDFNGDATAPNPPPVYLERFLHGAIYRVRPDVGAVVHSHAASVLPFGLVPDVALCPICHMSGFIRRFTPVFEIRDVAGDASDLLIRSLALGEALAHALDDHPLVLMRGHGMTVVGESLEQAVFRAVYTEANARIQLSATQLGGAIFLTDAEAAAADAANNGQVNRVWPFWSRRAAINVQRLQEAHAGTRAADHV